MRAPSPPICPLWTLFEESSGLCDVEVRFISLFFANCSIKVCSSVRKAVIKMRRYKNMTRVIMTVWAERPLKGGEQSSKERACPCISQNQPLDGCWTLTGRRGSARMSAFDLHVQILPKKKKIDKEMKMSLLAGWWRSGLTLVSSCTRGFLITMSAQIRVRPAENANYGAKSNLTQHSNNSRSQ